MHSASNEEIILENPSTSTMIDRVFFDHHAVFKSARISSCTKNIAWREISKYERQKCSTKK